MKRGSLRLRLLLAGAVSVIAALALSAFGLTILFERHVERRLTAELGVHLNQIIAGLDRAADGALTQSREPADPRFAQPLSGLYWQVEIGEAALRSRSLWDQRLVLPADALADGAVHQHRIAGPGDRELLALERSVTLPTRLSGGTARAVVALDTADMTAATRAFATDLLPYLTVIAFLLIAAGYVQVSVGLRPLGAVRKRLAAIRGGETRRLGDEFPDEILPLAAEVDALLQAREGQVDQARARAGDLAHGLKTPLQVLAGDVERLRNKGEDQIANDIDHIATAMRRHVDRELARVRMAADAGDARALVGEVVERVFAVLVRTPVGAKLNWSVDVPKEIAARIDPDDLAEAIGNLVENAVKHARTKVSITAKQHAGLVLISVADDGAGIPQDRLDEALARGGRFGEVGDGAGLGLAIVRDIAEAWGGRFEICTGSAGFEAEFGVQLAHERIDAT